MVRDSVAVTLLSHPKYLCIIRDVTARMAIMSGIGEETTDQIKLAVDEACSNVIKHAYKGDTTKRIVVEFRTTEKRFEVIIEDSGPKVDPACLRGRDLDDVKPGGLGIHFIKRVFDVFTFDQRKKRGNRLKLIKNLERKNEDRDNQ
jgi:anti-sigma regulatory factor (Ser/Thr protein kinase)